MNNQAPELSPEARRLINEARGADDPTAEDRDRVKARWLASVAAVAGLSSLTEAARAAGGIGWGFKAVGAALVIAAGVVGLKFALEADDSAVANKPASGGAASGWAASGWAASGAPRSDVPAATPRAALPGSSGSSPERFQKTPRWQTESELPANAGSSADPARPAAPSPQPAPADAAELAQPPVARMDGPSPGPAGAPGEPAGALGEAAVGRLGAPESPVAPPAVSQPAPVIVSHPAAGVRARPAPRAAVARSSNAQKPKETAQKPKETARPVSPPPEAAPVAEGPGGQLSEELALLSDVRSGIQEGAALRALELLARYESRFGQPILGMEADALRVDALCKAGQRDAARESARAFQKEWPGSPLERRVSAACP